MIAIGIDVGGTTVKGAAIKDNGDILGRFTLTTNKSAPAEETIGQICDAVNELIKNNDYHDKIVGIGIGIPGTFNKETGVIINCPNIPTWTNFNLKKFMEERTHLYVKIVNDADAAALAEAKFGVGKDYNYLLMITLGTGVGGGIVINKNLYNGNLGTGAELGHMVIELDGKQCGCGRKGCFEAYASASALIRDTKEAMEKHPESALHEVVQELCVLDARAAFIAEKRGDPVAAEVVSNYVRYLSEGLLNYCNIFRPNIIVLSGGVANEGDNLIKRVKEYMKKYHYGMLKVPEVEIKKASLGYDSGKIGAAALYF